MHIGASTRFILFVAVIGFAFGHFGCSSDDEMLAPGPVDAGTVEASDAHIVLDAQPADATPGDGGFVDTGPADTGPPDLTPDEVFLPRTGINRDEVVVLTVAGDARSRAIGAYYAEARGLADTQIIEVRLSTASAVLSPEAFAPVRDAVEAALSPDIQAVILAWTRPYRVGCMSITSAFSFGFDTSYCNRTGGPCGPTRAVDYPLATTRPWSELGFRPTIMLAVESLEAAEALIDRGVAADDTFPTGDGYFVRTNDGARSVRFPQFQQMPALWSHEGGLTMRYFDAPMGDPDRVADTGQVLFYLTGRPRVPQIESNTYLPGALADHLTSFGGRVPTAGSQMSVTAWLEAGVTGSYGTTVEPCNYLSKFPEPRRLVESYFLGSTLVEAYYKSVRWPGEGLFVGEPLARPFGHVGWRVEDDELVIDTTAIRPGTLYRVEGAPAADGPWTLVIDDFFIDRPARTEIRAPLDGSRYYRLVTAP